MNFYQSQLRNYINTTIYKKPSFELEFSWQQLFWITKSQKRLGKTLNRFMTHGVETDLQQDIEKYQKELSHIQRDYKKSRGDIFFQLWCVYEIGRRGTEQIKSDQELTDTITKQKSEINTLMREKYKLLPSWREHMPDATIVLDLNQGVEYIRSWYSRSCKRYINKAKKQKLTYMRATNEQRPQFWKIWYEMAYDKWFAVVWEETFLELMEYLAESQQWDLFLAMKDNEIVSGSVMLWIGKNLYYLYGATNRAYGDIWWHYWLKDQIFDRASGQWYVSCDLLGVAPPYHIQWHYLEWVTRFKQSFGGETVLYIWNYDLVFNSLLYRTMQTLKK